MWLYPLTWGAFHDTTSLGVFILFLKLRMVLSNFPGPQRAQLERLHPGHLMGRKLPPQKEGGRAPAPAFPAGSGRPIALRENPLSSSCHAHPHLWKALISILFLSGHARTPEASGTNEGVQSGWGGRPAHTHHLPVPSPPPAPQEAGQGWMRPTS